MKKKTTWLYTYKWRPYEGWGLWTDEFVGTEEQFQYEIKRRHIEPVKIKKTHWKPQNERSPKEER